MNSTLKRAIARSPTCTRLPDVCASSRSSIRIYDRHQFTSSWRQQEQRLRAIASRATRRSSNNAITAATLIRHTLLPLPAPTNPFQSHLVRGETDRTARPPVRLRQGSDMMWRPLVAPLNLPSSTSTRAIDSTRSCRNLLPPFHFVHPPASCQSLAFGRARVSQTQSTCGLRSIGIPGVRRSGSV